MRFFTNDRDERAKDEPAEPAAVPQQRPPSPWAGGPRETENRPDTDSPADVHDVTGSDDRPDTGGPTGAQGPGAQGPAAARTDVPDGALADRGTFDDPDVPGSGEAAKPFFGAPAEDLATAADRPAADAGRGDEPPFAEPAAQPSAFGATTVGGAVAASAMAGEPSDQRRDDLDQRADADSGVADDQLVAEPDRAGADRTDQSGADRAAHRAGDETAVLDDGGTFEDPVVVQPGGDARAFADTSAQRAAVPAPDTTDATGARAADQDATGARAADQDATGATGEDSVAAAAVPASAQAGPGAGSTGLMPGAVPDSGVGRLFADGDADRFRDRWRDVQLRFVDDPRTAATEAAGLIDEAVDALADSIRRQKGKLADPVGDDTEQLRVQLRTYREFLNRLLEL